MISRNFKFSNFMFKLVLYYGIEKMPCKCYCSTWIPQDQTKTWCHWQCQWYHILAHLLDRMVVVYYCQLITVDDYIFSNTDKGPVID
jgi:hypothetical protein